MLATVSLERLNQVMVGKDSAEKRIYVAEQVLAEDTDWGLLIQGSASQGAGPFVCLETGFIVSIVSTFQANLSIVSRYIDKSGSAPMDDKSLPVSAPIFRQRGTASNACRMAKSQPLPTARPPFSLSFHAGKAFPATAPESLPPRSTPLRAVHKWRRWCRRRCRG